LKVEVPQVRGLGRPHRSQLWQLLKRRTEALTKLVLETYARGLSTRDIEDALSELNESQGSLPSRSTVSRLTEALWEEYEAFPERDLSGYGVVYLFADVVYESFHLERVGRGDPGGVRRGHFPVWTTGHRGSPLCSASSRRCR